MSIYAHKLKTRDGREVSLAEYRGKVLLIVNTATGCGFTPQYKELQALYEAYKNRGLEILDIPCNQFGEQAPGSDEEIHTFCTGRFGVTFPQFAKSDVVGENALPLFRYLTEHTAFGGFDMAHPIGPVLHQILSGQDPDYAKSGSVKWNFTKFLVGRDGRILARYEPTASMDAVRDGVREAL